MADIDHLGQGHHDEPYVGLIRGISPEVHLETLNREKATSFDEGWQAGIDFAIGQTRAETRAIRRRHIERLACTYRAWRRRFVEEFLCSALLVALPLLTIWLLKGG